MTRLFNLLRALGFDVTQTETVGECVGEPGPNSESVRVCLPSGRTFEVKWTWPVKAKP